MRLSPLAALVLKHHRARPDKPMYDIAVLGTRMPKPEGLEQLAAAYRELEQAGMVEATGDVERYRGRFYYMYRPVHDPVAVDPRDGEGSAG